MSNQVIAGKMTDKWGPTNHPDRLSDDLRKEWPGRYIENQMRNERFTLLDEILNEHIRQITKHGYTKEYDDEHADGSIADAAAHYASTKDDTGLWPWDAQCDNKSSKTRREQIVVAMSMLLAELERLDHAKKLAS